jgi:hypothetical protein
MEFESHELNPLKGMSLQLGASCYDRLLDLFSPGNVSRGVPISMIRMPTLFAEELSLTLAISLFAMLTYSTRARGVSWINHIQWDTSKSSLIGEKETELPE